MGGRGRGGGGGGGEEAHLVGGVEWVVGCEDEGEVVVVNWEI